MSFDVGTNIAARERKRAKTHKYTPLVKRTGKVTTKNMKFHTNR